MARIDGMVDLETLDTLPTAQVLTIGGVKFNPLTYEDPFDEFYFRFEIDEQEVRGRTVSESTLTWWGTQDDEVVLEAFGEHNRTDVVEILQQFKKWNVGLSRIWAQGITFDITMLENLCRQYEQPLPWAFWNVEDSRTLLNRMPKDPRKDSKFTAHNALEDARHQAIAVQKTFSHFGFTK